VNERLALVILSLLALLSLFFAPWASINRETGARGTLLLLPNRTVDFTGRTDPVPVPGQGVTLAVSALSLVAVAGASALRGRARYAVWLGAGLALVVTVAAGMGAVERATGGAQLSTLLSEAQEELEDPGRRTDVDALRAALAQVEEVPLETFLEALQDAGMRVRRLPYEETGMGLSAALTLGVGLLALLFGLRLFPRAGRLLDRALSAVAVPATSILLALVAAAVVVLALQPTPLGDGVEVSGFTAYLAGRLDVLWYAYESLFIDSLGTLEGFLEALKFATPLIFTGLAVAFGFRAGLFNIGAPGQMALGAIFTMLVGVYLPGPRMVVLPLAVLAAALGGGLWGALPGWLKARFGANEVINTILLNYIAASLLLFILSAQQVFAASVLRIFVAIGIFALLALLLTLIPAIRARLGASPRGSAAVLGVLLLGVVVVAGLPRAGDAPVNLGLPFKAPGSEPKSYELSEAARLPQLPAIVGVPPGTFGEATVPVNYGLLLAPAAALLAFGLLGGRRFRLPARLALALGVGALAYLIAALTGLTARPTVIPPSKLNASFALALASAALMYVLMWRTRWGYELRAVGLAPKAAEYGGASVPRNIVLAMSVSGAFAGLAASHYVVGAAL